MANYVYSTLPNSQMYTTYHPQEGSNQVIRKDKQVLIKGGSGMANKHLITPLGVGTQVSDDELEILEQHRLFQQHVKNGYMVVKSYKTNPEKVAADMETRDGSSPIVPGDFKESDLVTPMEADDEDDKGNKGKGKKRS